MDAYLSTGNQQIATSIIVGAIVARWLYSRIRARRWISVRDKRRLQRDDELARTRAFVEADALSPALLREIQALDLPQLAEQIAKKKYTALTVLRAYLTLALEAHEKTNCLTGVMLDVAVREAKAADAHLASTGKVLGPLHGVPISIKENIRVKGCDTTIGNVSRAFDVSGEDAVIVSCLRRAGAVPFVKTNIPQTLLSFECDNPLFGRTTNPYSKHHTCGGSSGGEAALVALKGTPAGVGSDIGGSCRIPATFCGTYGIKPGVGRLPVRGSESTVKGQEALAGVCGFLTRSPEACAYLHKSVEQQQPWLLDPSCCPLVWRQDVYESYRAKKKLRIGVIEHDGFLRASPANLSALHLTIDALRAAGHEVVTFDAPEMAELTRVYYAAISSDGGTTVLRGFDSDEPTATVVGSVMRKLRAPTVLKRMIAGVIRTVVGDALFADLLLNFLEVPVHGLFKIVKRRNELRNLFLDRFAADGLDAVLTPGFTLPAVPHDSFPDITFAAASTLVFNVLDWSVVSVPVTRLSVARDAKHRDAAPVAESRVARGFAARVYPRCLVDGLPLGVQLSAPRLCDEQVLGVTSKVHEVLAKAGLGEK
eukprot:PhM_4_TR9071/c0_g1_i1/m.56414